MKEKESKKVWWQVHYQKKVGGRWHRYDTVRSVHLLPQLVQMLVEGDSFVGDVYAVRLRRQP